ncbi:potassium channel family protein [Methanobrevibacter sp. DSM 116169]|uniref:potassium channel family protein n=1 Tax=Methanobrevibacter sp. DSM 116169 TaxID=3242727 RepID=UPI0038FCF9ED
MLLIKVFDFQESIFIYIIHFIHLIALIISLKFLGSKFIDFTQKNNLNYGIITIIAIFIFSSLTFFIVEGNINPTVNYFDDAIWFSLASVTSTGYGDVVPITDYGRLIGSFLMISGIGFASFLTASASSTFIENYNKEKESKKVLYEKILENQNNIKEELKLLKDSIDELNNKK